ncbi:MAG: Hsp20/alpha crystallin family protein [Breznakibacter sp.]
MSLLRRSESNVPSFPGVFDNWFNRDLMDWMDRNFSDTYTTVPAANIHETDNEFQIEVAVPGMEKGDFNVSLDRDLLTISSEKRTEKKEEKKGSFSRKEFSYQSFQRSFHIPQNLVDGDKIAAKYDNGILHITLPKREEVKPKPPKTIHIA